MMSTTSTEIERKYEIPAAFELPDLSGLPDIAVVERTGDHRLDAVYYDTVDLRLEANKMTLRRREGGDDAGWHLKRPAGSDRSETREPLSDELPGTLATAVKPLVGSAELVPVAHIRTHRSETSLYDKAGRVLAVIAEDDVRGDRLIADAVTAGWREVEVELVDGDRSLQDAIEVVLRSAGATPSGSRSKLARALHGPAVNSEQSRGGRRLAAYLRAQRDAIAGTDPLVRGQDIDGVHDMRVAVRRTRAALRTFRPILDRARTEPLRAELHWLARQLGTVRDNDVLSADLDRMLDGLPSEQIVGPVRGRIRERLVADGIQARQSLVEALDSQQYAAIRDELDAVIAMAHPRVTTGRLRIRARKALRRADARLDRAVSIDEAGPSDDPDVALHEARKAYKRARYALEVVQPLVGETAKKLGKRLSELQDVLGDHQDAVVTARLMREFALRAHLDGDNAYTYGVLYERAVQAGARRLDDLPAARRRVATIRM